MSFRLKTTILSAAFAAFASMGSASTITTFDATSAVGSGADHSIWLSNGITNTIGREFDFRPAGRFAINSDGTATLTGQVVSQDDGASGFTVAFNYDSTFLQTPIFKSENGSTPGADLRFYDMEGGTLTGYGALAGLNLSVARAPVDGTYATQVGTGANNKNGNLGMANWFKVFIDEANCLVCAGPDFRLRDGSQGDVNVDLVATPLPAGGLLVLTGIGAMAALRRRRKTTT
ncbi:MAG: VPLPA-CTERM sorting domain-containing protein [Pseudomonadota bacterium]